MRDGGATRLLESLPPEMRERFEAAREKAMQDPKLRELRRTAEKAKRDFFKAMRTKMMEIDPTLADMVRKRVIERKARRAWKDEDGTPGFDSLNRDEREKLLAALERAHDDPTVQAAKEKKWDAITPAERTVAREVYRKAIQEAMIKVDPSLAPILEKLSAKARRVTKSGKAGRRQSNRQRAEIAVTNRLASLIGIAETGQAAHR